MKIGFMTFACPDWGLTQVVEAATRLNYHGVEFRCDANHLHGVEVYTNAQERREIAARLEAAGLEVCCLATSLQFIDPRVLEDAPPRIELAAALRCPGLRVLCGPLPEAMREDEAIDRVADHLRAAAELADQAAVELWLETHDSVSRAEHAAQAVRRADHRALGLTYDNLHPYRAGEPVAATMAAMEGLVRHTHFHDGLNRPDAVRIRPMGQGQMPLDEMFAGLLAMGYDGYLSGEWFHDMYGVPPLAALERFRQDVQALLARHGVNLVT